MPFAPSPSKSLAEQLQDAVAVANAKKSAREQAQLAVRSAEAAYDEAVAKARVLREEFMKSLGDIFPADNAVNHKP